MVCNKNYEFSLALSTTSLSLVAKKYIKLEVLLTLIINESNPHIYKIQRLNPEVANHA